MTPTNAHDSQMLPQLLDPKKEHDNVWDDSAYSAECFESLLSLVGFENPIQEKGARNHPINDAAEELNPIKSAIRACVKHVFGSITMSTVRKLSKKVSLERTEVRQGFKNLIFNFLRYLQHTSNAAIVA